MEALSTLRIRIFTSSLIVAMSCGCKMPWMPTRLAQTERTLGDRIEDDDLQIVERKNESWLNSSEADLGSEPRRLASDLKRSTEDQFEADLRAAEKQLTPMQADLLRKQSELIEQLKEKAARSEQTGQSYRFSDADENEGDSLRQSAGQAPAIDSAEVIRPTEDSVQTLDHANGGSTVGVSEANHKVPMQQPSVPEIDIPIQPKDVASPTSQPSTEAMEKPWKDIVREARERLEVEISNMPSPEQRIELSKAMRLLSLSIEDLDQALEPIPGIDGSLQEYYQHTMQAWKDATDPSGHPDLRKRATLALASQRRATRLLAAASDLTVSNASFCTSVNSYGDVQRFDEYRFKAGDEVLLYCEVDNFSTAALPNGKEVETHLRGTYKILDRSGRPIDTQALPANKEASETVRRDYFMVYRIWLPESIQPGNYELSLVIEDLHGHKHGTASIGFEVGQ